MSPCKSVFSFGIESEDMRIPCGNHTKSHCTGSGSTCISFGIFWVLFHTDSVCLHVTFLVVLSESFLDFWRAESRSLSRKFE